MRVAQELYEGVELGDEGAVGLITYMRTDSTRVSELAAQQARDYLTTLFGAQFLAKAAAALRQGRAGEHAGRARSGASHGSHAPARARQEVSDARAVQALRADLEALHGVADGAGGVRHDDGRLSHQWQRGKPSTASRALSVPLHGQHREVRGLPHALSRGARGGGGARARGRAGASRGRAQREDSRARRSCRRSTSPSRRRDSPKRAS